MTEVAEILTMPRRPEKRQETIYEKAERRRKRKQPPRMPTREEVRRLLGLMRQRHDAERDYPLFLLMLETGIRAGTAAGLTVGDARGPKGECRRFIRLRPEIVKGGYSYTVPLRREVRLVLSAYLGERDGKPEEPLFASRKGGEHLTVRAIEYAWQRWQQEAAVEKPYRLHAARHYAITRLSERIGNPLVVKALAGHQSIQTTQRYTHPSDDALLDAVEQAFEGD